MAVPLVTAICNGTGIWAAAESGNSATVVKIKTTFPNMRKPLTGFICRNIAGAGQAKNGLQNSALEPFPFSHPRLSFQFPSRNRQANTPGAAGQEHN